MPQFITLHLADSLPKDVIIRWREELVRLKDWQQKDILQRRIERYLDQGYGNSYLRVPEVAEMIQAALLKVEQIRYQIFSWVAQPSSLLVDPL
jgi:putative DNA methylase